MLCVLVLLPACAHYTPLHHHHSLSYTPQTSSSSSSLFHVLQLPDSRRDRAGEDHLSLSLECVTHMVINPTATTKGEKKKKKIRVSLKRLPVMIVLLGFVSI